jgi:2-phospho-L-lactate guanylyltransferase
VVIPVRGEEGKSRLATILGPSARVQLIRAMARHVVKTVLGTGEIDGPVAIVTRDSHIDWLPEASDPRVRVVYQPLSSPGLNPALDAGREAVAARGPGRLLVLPADLPGLRLRDLDRLLADPAPVVIGPDAAGSGTNALVLAGHGILSAFRFQFGQGSRSLHEAEARRLGVESACVDTPGISHDLDTPADWAMLTAELRDRLGLAGLVADAAPEPAALLETA